MKLKAYIRSGTLDEPEELRPTGRWKIVYPDGRPGPYYMMVEHYTYLWFTEWRMDDSIVFLPEKVEYVNGP